MPMYLENEKGEQIMVPDINSSNIQKSCTSKDNEKDKSAELDEKKVDKEEKKEEEKAEKKDEEKNEEEKVEKKEEGKKQEQERKIEQKEEEKENKEEKSQGLLALTLKNNIIQTSSRGRGRGLYKNSTQWSHKGKNEHESQKLQNIQIPVTRSKGRPAAGSTKKPEVYKKQSHDTKINNLLIWLGIDNDHRQVLKSRQGTLKEEHVGNFRIRDSFMEKKVDISILRSYFEIKAFKLFTDIVLKKRKENKFVCEVCLKEAVTDVVKCASCSVWRHFECDSYDVNSGKNKTWFCSTCS